MNKIILITVLSLFFCNCDAQTYYYKLTKKIERKHIYTNTAGGQFITFLNDKCYESDIKGRTVNNSELTYDSYYSGKFLVYVGISYFGSNVKFKFTQDKSLLNVETKDGRIYVYKRQVAPASVVTCSLIIKEKVKDPKVTQQISNINSGKLYTGPNGSNFNSFDINSTNNSNGGASRIMHGNQGTKNYHKDCHLCGGSGKCRTCNGTHRILNPLTNNYQTCPNCKPDGVCAACKGTGQKR